MSLLRRQLLQLAAGVVASPAVSLLAHAQAYPSRSVRVIVPVGPGGQNDTIVRLVAQKLSENLGQSYYVENQGGGSGNIGMGAAARAPADGYTILAAGGNFVINPSLYAKIPYDPVADFTPVTMLCSSPHVLAVHPSVPAVSVKELVALAQADPGKLSYASAGRGTPAHLAGELFRLAFGVDVTHVPFSGGGQAITSTIGGHTSMAVSAVPTAAPYIRGGNVRALAVMSATRTSVLPGVPTMAEAGRPLEADIVTGLLVRAGTPREIVELLHREVVRVMAAPEVRERLVTLGFEPVAGSPEEFAAWIRNEIAKWANVIRDANITPQ
ncbi:MAG: Bug family tripartite tricarboxylate transporter substrate binding protein [Xanthobacteraceae bacterium]|jgi:tripartite-type tricarboxylate transporter receptor subunit TctC